MSLTATARSIPGTLRQEVVINGRHGLITDQPVRVGGDGSGPSPHDLFPAALSACVAATLVSYARTKGWNLGEVTVGVDYDHRSTPRRVEIDIQLTGELTGAQVERRRGLPPHIRFDVRSRAASSSSSESSCEMSRRSPGMQWCRRGAPA